MKKVLLILLLIFLSACVSVSVDETTTDPDLDDENYEEVAEDTDVDEEEPVETEPEDTTTDEETSDTESTDNPPEYTFMEGDTKVLFGTTFTVTNIKTDGEVNIEINGETYNILETKSREVIENVDFWVQELHIDKSGGDDYIILHAEELSLEENQYILRKGITQTIEGKDVSLSEATSKKYINVKVLDEGTVIGTQDLIAFGESEKINGLEITNDEAFYKVSQYAIVTVVPVS